VGYRKRITAAKERALTSDPSPETDRPREVVDDLAEEARAEVEPTKHEPDDAGEDEQEDVSPDVPGSPEPPD
jgi:hypothetical protein